MLIGSLLLLVAIDLAPFAWAAPAPANPSSGTT
jgi:hypothetical protein